MKTIYEGKIMSIEGIFVESKERERCIVELDPGAREPMVTTHGTCWGWNEYHKTPLCFIPFKVSDQVKLETIRLFEEAYGSTENDVEDWALEFELFVRMILADQLMINPKHLSLDKSDDFFEKILAITKKQEKITADTPLGKIEAITSPDSEYPGIFLNYIGKNGCPGAVMDYSPTANTVEMRVYGAEAPDGEPVNVLTMASREQVYSDSEDRFEVTNTSSVISDRKDAFAILDKKYDRLYADPDGTVLTYPTRAAAKKGLSEVITRGAIMSQVNPEKITGTAYISVSDNDSGVYVDLNYAENPDGDVAGTDYDILFAARPDDEGGFCRSDAKYEASYIAKVASRMFHIGVRTD